MFHEDAPRDGRSEEYLARYRRLGQFIPEGSKSGAAAAAVYVSHKVLPLDHAHFGQLPRQTILAAEAFHEAADRLAQELEGVARVVVPFAPDSNLVCLAINPHGNERLEVANAFVRALHRELRTDGRQPLQLREFFGTTTTLRPQAVGGAEMARILRDVGLDPSTLDGDGDGDDDHLLILRHTLMNPYLVDHANGISYIDRYLEFLAQRIRALQA